MRRVFTGFGLVLAAATSVAQPEGCAQGPEQDSAPALELSLYTRATNLGDKDDACFVVEVRNNGNVVQQFRVILDVPRYSVARKASQDGEAVKPALVRRRDAAVVISQIELEFELPSDAEAVVNMTGHRSETTIEIEPGQAHLVKLVIPAERVFGEVFAARAVMTESGKVAPRIVSNTIPISASH